MKIEDIMLIIEKSVKSVVDDHIEVDINIEPDRLSIEMQPWEKFKMECPYGK